MEAVAADVIVLIILGGNGVAVGLGGHGHVEGSVEHGHLRRVGHNRLAGPDAHQVGGVVQGAQGDAFLDGLDAGIVNDAGIGELHAAVQDTMANGIDLVSGLDHALHRIYQDLENRLDGLGVGGHGDILHDLLVTHLVGKAAVNVDTLAQALGGNDAGIRVHQLVLQAGGTGIDNQNVHRGQTS